MKLPNLELACVPESKITDYLLNRGHPAGRSKAVFFLRFGFTVARWDLLAEALLKHADSYELVSMEKSSYGTRFVVDGSITAPDGTPLNIRCAWFIEDGTAAPRFVTAHPLPKP